MALKTAIWSPVGLFGAARKNLGSAPGAAAPSRPGGLAGMTSDAVTAIAATAAAAASGTSTRARRDLAGDAGRKAGRLARAAWSGRPLMLSGRTVSAAAW